MCEQAIGECSKNLSRGLCPLLTSLTAGFHDDNMISLQKRYGLYGLEHHRQMENEKNVTNVDTQTYGHSEYSVNPASRLGFSKSQVHKLS